MTKLEALADTLLVLGAALAITTCALISLVLALAVSSALCILVGILLTFFISKKPKRPPGVIDRGPFGPDGEGEGRVNA